MFVISWFFIIFAYFLMHYQGLIDLDDMDNCLQNSLLEYSFGQFNENQCIKQFGLAKKSIIMIYYSFTTFSTVGLGDYHPRSDLERLVIAPTLLFGVICIAQISNEFVKIIQKIELIEKDFEDQNGLHKFTQTLIRKYNGNRHLHNDLEHRISEFF